MKPVFFYVAVAVCFVHASVALPTTAGPTDTTSSGMIMQTTNTGKSLLETKTTSDGIREDRTTIAENQDTYITGSSTPGPTRTTTIKLEKIDSSTPITPTTASPVPKESRTTGSGIPATITTTTTTTTTKC